ncbi:hypothetical protein D0T84_10155 [Dysgonomonas sp. 521]|uniref:glycoside hydrolase domain-containing protein n=1 Tax=Dysgonomonas sp. 521 TaxID=2302932 RepID=UPI0013D45940|nr:glycoside hydrolase domain-containing protein [Dysgonomonas sp. 521]NDV95281.1 hypothetical protein [Dysgonomonas sp. 521]
MRVRHTILIISIVNLLFSRSNDNRGKVDLSKWVNPFVGTLHEGYCFPGATVPLGNPNNPMEANKYLPRWGLWGKETNTMIGNHTAIDLPNGKLFRIKADNLSTGNYIVSEVWLKGKQLNRLYITHDEIMKGGDLRFVMKADKENILGILKSGFNGN